MMRYAKYVIICVGILFGACSQAVAGHVVVAISPNNTAQELQSNVEDLLRNTLEIVQPGEKAFFVDADALKLIASMEVPDQPGYNNLRAKVAINGEAMRALKVFFEAPQDGPARRINPPALFRFVAENYPASRPSVLLISGSPLYADPRAPGLSMADGRYPNDAHLLERPGQSPYGTQGYEQGLQNYRVFWTFGDADWARNPQHEAAVRRAWLGTIAAMGGTPIALESDPETVLMRLRSGASESLPVPKLKQGGTPTMILLQRRAAERQDVFQRPVAQAALSETALRSLDGLDIGIVWDCETCDLDLHVRPADTARMIFFGDPHTPEGRLLKDYLKSPGPDQSYETVSLTAPVDARQLLVAVNLFNGTTSRDSVSGRIRFALADEAWEVPFTILAKAGNAGLGREVVLIEQNTANPNWILIDPMKVMRGQ